MEERSNIVIDDSPVQDGPIVHPVVGAPAGLTSRELADEIARILDDKLGSDIVLLDMTGVVSYTDWFVIATGRAARQTQALAEEVRLRLKQDHRALPARVEGVRQGGWILLDYIDVVVHIFTPEMREFYRLDQLWGQVPAIAWES